MGSEVGREVRRLREERGWGQAKLAVEAGMAVSGVSQIENGKRNPNSATLIKLARALGVEVVDLFPKADRRSSREPTLFNGALVEERRGSRFAEAIIAAAEKWGEAVSSSETADSTRLVLTDAALSLSDLISQSVEEEDWDTIPNQERREIIATMEKLVEAAGRGTQSIEESVEAKAQEQKARENREKIRELTRRIA